MLAGSGRQLCVRRYDEYSQRKEEEKFIQSEWKQ